MMPAISRILLLSVFIFVTTQCKNPEKIQKKDEMENKQEKQNVDDNTLNIDYLMGKFDPSSHALFSAIDIKYADRKGLFMRTEAYKAFKEMFEAAKEKGIHLQIRSAARNFDYQKGIWERKWRGETILSDNVNASEITNEKERAQKILLYSSMPGTSRHHWGTDIDLNSFNNKWFESGEGLQIYTWLTDNASSYGFCQVYTAKNEERPHGYEEEKWHWSYEPISKPLTIFAQKTLTNDNVLGFLGDHTASDIDVVKKYVLGIHPSCFL